MRGYVENSIPPQPQVPQCKISETWPIVIELHTAFQNLFTIWHFSGQLVDGDQAGAILRRARQTVQANCPTSNFSRKGQAILIKMPTILKISKIPALYTMLSQKDVSKNWFHEMMSCYWNDLSDKALICSHKESPFSCCWSTNSRCYCCYSVIKSKNHKNKTSISKKF